MPSENMLSWVKIDHARHHLTCNFIWPISKGNFSNLLHLEFFLVTWSLIDNLTDKWSRDVS